MRFAQFTLASSFMLFTGSIVVPATGSVNPQVVNLQAPAAQMADGMPLPPPPREDAGNLLADGMPLPPPPRLSDAALMADGMPLPPPPRFDQGELLADGMPLPPPPRLEGMGEVLA